MKVKLLFEEFKTIIEVIEYYKYSKKLTFIYSNYHIQIGCTIDDTINLRELCSDYLAIVGFDKNYNTNKIGDLLETLIDKLYIQ